MDFFEHQHHARRHTRLMLLMFVLAVTITVVMLNLLGALIWATAADMHRLPLDQLWRRLPGPLLPGITLLALAVIGGGTLYTRARLAGGGEAVAAMVGARRLARDSREPQERQLLNVVEEMAIASGITVPAVYVMDDEASINAFAAGYSPNQAVVAVTRGTLERLDRDELQGVVGHEFSHILNGDMRLNLHLMGVIAGLVMFGAMGRFLLRGSRGRGKRGSDSALLAAGLGLWLIGSIGVLAGRLIKSAIARQREYLADASAVQFTRNPEGIAGALAKIGKLGGSIGERHAEELSHMYIGEPISSMFGWFDTHPPIARRIERLVGPAQARGLIARAGDALAEASAASMSVPAAAYGLAGGEDPSMGGSSEVLASIGQPRPAHMLAARELIEGLPTGAGAMARSADGARTLLYALLLKDATRDAQAALLRDAETEAGVAQVMAWSDILRLAGPRQRMPVLELLLPTLAGLALAERESVLSRVDALVRADRQVTLSEFVIQTLCRRQLGPPPPRVPRQDQARLEDLAPQAGLVLSLLGHAGGAGAQGHAQAMTALGLPAQPMHGPGQLGVGDVEAALNALCRLAPLRKPVFIKACLALVMRDGQLNVAEGELMRLVCSALDSPLPPLSTPPVPPGATHA